MEIPNGTGPGVRSRVVPVCMPYSSQLFYGKLSKPLKGSSTVTRLRLVTKSSVSVKSDRWRVSLYMVMQKNGIKESGEGDFILFNKIPLSKTELP